MNKQSGLLTHAHIKVVKSVQRCWCGHCGASMYPQHRLEIREVHLGRHLTSLIPDLQTHGHSQSHIHNYVL